MVDELGVEAGQVIAGKYRLVELLGRGGMGSVWRADHLSLLSQVALKVIKPEVAKNQSSIARFMREAKAAAMLRSPHVVQVLDHGVDGAIAYIAMELLEGESLLGRLRRQGALGPTLTATVITHVGRAIQKAHDAGIIHRDLKPDNVFLVDNDDEVVAKVLDFGIAKTELGLLDLTGESPQTQTGALLGTPYYMSPEQATAQKDVDHRADLWALGVIAFECLLGKRPYQSDALGDLLLQICARDQPVPSELGPVPEGFDAWFARSQARDPAQRFQSAKEMVRELRRVLARPLVHPSSTTAGGLPEGSSFGSARTPLAGTPAAMEEAPSPAAADGQNGLAATERVPSLHEAESHGREAAGATAARGSPGERHGDLQTLDPVARVAAPSRRRFVVGAAAVGLAIFAALLGVQLLGERAEPGPVENPSPGAEAVPSEASEPATASAPSADTASAPNASSSADAGPPPSATAPAPRPPRTATAPPPTKTPTPTKPDDPLGI